MSESDELCHCLEAAGVHLLEASRLPDLGKDSHAGRVVGHAAEQRADLGRAVDELALRRFSL
jgi:hypothetical protein